MVRASTSAHILGVSQCGATDQPVTILANQLGLDSHSHHQLNFFPLSKAIASQSLAEGPDIQGAKNKRFFSFFLFQTMSFAQTSGGGNPGTQKWGRGT